MKILVVDDCARMRKIIATFLGSEDNEIFELRDGQEAVELYGKIKPDWVLLDIKMNRLNGFEAASKIKAEYPDAHIIFVTNHDENSYRKYATKLGADGFVSKQNLSELKEVINKKK